MKGFLCCLSYRKLLGVSGIFIAVTLYILFYSKLRTSWGIVIKFFIKISVIIIASVGFLFYSKTVYSDPILEKYLEQRNTDTITFEKYDALVKKQLKNYVGLIYPEVQAIAEGILKTFDPKTHYFLHIGSGPFPITTYLKNKAGVMVNNIPLTAFHDDIFNDKFWIVNSTREKYNLPVQEYLDILKDHFDRFIPKKVLTGEYKVVLIDTVQTGVSLVNAHRRISEYIHRLSPNVEVTPLALLHPSANGEMFINFNSPVPHLRLYDQLGMLLHNRVFDPYAEYVRFEPGLIDSADVVKNPKFSRFEKFFRAYMRITNVELKPQKVQCIQLF